MSKLTKQLNIRVSERIIEQLESVARFEGKKVPELLRGWITDELKSYRRSRPYQKWVASKPEEAEELKKSS